MEKINHKINLVREQCFDAETPPENISSVLWSIFRNRGVDGPEELDYSLKHLLPYTDMKNCLAAAKRLADAIAQQEKIVIVGDYDVDGATSTTLGMLALTDFGAENINFLVPNRFEFGYGLSPEIVEEAKRLFDPDLIITVDNGIASCDGVARAGALNIEVIITDHHLAGDKLPETPWIVNPNQPGCTFESKSIAGVGVIFYLLCALRSELDERGHFQQRKRPNIANYLDLVALGTVADVVVLDRNNRVLVDNGMRRIRAGACRPGIAAIAQVSRRQLASLRASDLGFAIGPRLNAAGRLDDMSLGIRCLLSNSATEAMGCAQELDNLNLERREIESQMKADAALALAKLDRLAIGSQLGITLYDEQWHQGVIGILAGRVKDAWGLPCVVFAPDENGVLKGSARSIEGLNIRDCLEEVAKVAPDAILNFGGHAMAAGLRIQAAHLAEFKAQFNRCVSEFLGGEAPAQELVSAASLTERELNLHFAHTLHSLGPWGNGFPEPLFDNEFYLYRSSVLKDKHLKMVVSKDKSGQQCYDAIWFNAPVRHLEQLPEKLHLVYRLDINEFRQRQSLQLIVEHLCEPDFQGQVEIA